MGSKIAIFALLGLGVLTIFNAVSSVTPEEAMLSAGLIAFVGIGLFFGKGVGWEQKLFLGMLLTLSFYRVGQISLPLFRIFPAQTFILLLTGQQLLKRIYYPRALDGMRKHPLILPMLSFFVICILSVYKSAWIPSNSNLYPLLNSSARNAPYIKSITQVFWIAIGFAAFFLTTSLIRTREGVVTTTRYIIFGQMLTAALSFVQAFGHVLNIGPIIKLFRGGALVHGLYDDLGISAFRVTSVFTEPSHLAVFHGIVIPLAIIFAIQKVPILNKKQRILFVGLVLSSFILTFSRTTIMVAGFLGLLGLLAVARQSLLQKRGRKVSIAKVLIYLALIGCAAEIFSRLAYGGSIFDIIFFQFGTIEDKENVSNYSRLWSAITAWRMFLNHPLMGVGVGNYVFHIVDYAPIRTFRDLDYLMPIVGNIYLEILCETGVLGIASFIWILIAIRRYVKSAIRQTSDLELKSILSAQLAGFYTMLFGFLTFSAFFFPFVWAFIGWMIVTSREALKQRRGLR